MSSVTVSMPSESATRCPSRRLSGSESRSGISTPSTRFAPNAGDRKRSRDARIDAARQAEHDAAPLQSAQHLLAHRIGDARSLALQVERKPVGEAMRSARRANASLEGVLFMPPPPLLPRRSAAG